MTQPADNWKLPFLQRYAQNFNEVIDDVGGFLRVALDEQMVEVIAKGLERFVQALRKKDSTN